MTKEEKDAIDELMEQEDNPEICERMKAYERRA